MNDPITLNYDSYPSGLLVFKINDHEIGIDIKNVLSIINPYEEDPLTLQLEENESVIKYKNDVYFLVNLYELLGGKKTTSNSSTRIIVINHDNSSFAFFVDKIMEVVTLNQNSRNQLELTKSNPTPYSSGSINYDGEDVWIADLNKIVANSFN